MAKKQKMRTSKEKAHRAQMGVFARLAGCAYLIYIVVQLLKESGTEDGAMSETMKIVIAVVFLAIAAFIIGITVREAIIGYKQGLFSQSTYTDDFEEEKAEYERKAKEYLDDEELESSPEELAEHTQEALEDFEDEELLETEADGEMEDDEEE